MSASHGTVINSINLFVDTSDRIHAGDDCRLQVTPPLHIGDIPGASYKLTLTEFSMQRPNYTIDDTNNAFRVIKTTTGANPPVAVVNAEIPPGNVTERRGTATAFGLQLQAALGGNGFIVDNPQEQEDAEFTPGVGTLLLNVRVTFPALIPFDSAIVQVFDDSDSYLLLGGDRVADGSVDKSFEIVPGVDVDGVHFLRVVGRYPMQKTSLKHIYMRTDLKNTNLQSSSLNGAQAPSTHTTNSNILAKFPMAFEQINYASPGQDEFFIFLPQHTISSLRLYLTDHRNRPLARNGPNQATSGPMHFTATVRIDTLMRTPPAQLKTRPIPKTVPTRNLGPFYVTNDLLNG